MKITCQNKECGFIINIPPDRIPDKPVRIACPKCKAPNIITPPSSSESGGDLYEKVMSAVDRKIADLRNEILRQQPIMPGSFSPSIGPDSNNFQPEGSKKALICDDDKMICKVIEDSISKLGYSADGATTIEKALSVLDKPDIEYSLILIDKVFPEDPEGGFKILTRITSLPLDVRRKTFVVFISGDIKSMDATSAFLMGANAVVNKKDLDKLTGIIATELGEYERLYRVFSASLHMSKTYSH